MHINKIKRHATGIYTLKITINRLVSRGNLEELTIKGMTRHKTRIIRGRYLLFFFRYVAQKQWFLWINIINSTKCRHANKKISLNETRHKHSQTSISKYMYCIYSFQCNLRIIEKRARVWLRQILYMLELPSLIVDVYCN